MTGGGSPSIILDSFEEKVLSVIGDTAVTGVKSGVDTEEGNVKQLSHLFRYSEHSACCCSHKLVVYFFLWNIASYIRYLQ